MGSKPRERGEENSAADGRLLPFLSAFPLFPLSVSWAVCLARWREEITDGGERRDDGIRGGDVADGADERKTKVKGDIFSFHHLCDDLFHVLPSLQLEAEDHQLLAHGESNAQIAVPRDLDHSLDVVLC